MHREKIKRGGAERGCHSSSLMVNWRVLALFGALVLAFSGCKTDKSFGDTGEALFTLNAPDPHNKTFIQSFVLGAPLSVPADPVLDDYVFNGWYMESNMNTAHVEPYDFTMPEKSKTLTIYAWWLTKEGAVPDWPGNLTGEGGVERPFTGTVIDGINSTELWNDALGQIKNGGNNKSYRLKITGSFNVAGVSDATFEAVRGLDVEIWGQGSGLKISLESDGNMLRIGAGQRLTLNDIILQGKTDNIDSLVYVTSGTLEMKGRATVSGNMSTGIGGGGVYLTGSSTMIMNDNAAVSGNKAGGSGGGVYIDNSSILTMTMNSNAAISGNTASGLGGGGVYLTGSSTMTMNGTASISNNNILGYGGGAYLTGSSAMIMSGNAAISNNEAVNEGGGVYLESSSTMIMSGDTAISNNSTAINGGGVCLYGGAAMTMSDHAAILNNEAADRGGGVNLFFSCTMAMNGNATISGNKANEGGGVVLYFNCTMTVNGNAAISNNKADGRGGGVYLYNCTMTMNGNPTISGNKATGGGGIISTWRGNFRIAGGTVYGNGEANGIKNNASESGASLYLDEGTAQYGTSNTNGEWTFAGTLSSTDNTINVVNGVLQ